MGQIKVLNINATLSKGIITVCVSGYRSSHFSFMAGHLLCGKYPFPPPLP